MKIAILPARTLDEIQDEFTAAFPFLKLEFFTEAHRAFDPSRAAARIEDGALKLGDLQPTLVPGDLVFDGATVTADLERTLETRFGLHAQVFRKAHTSWLSTSRTDFRTLAEQNERGAADEQPHAEEEPIDYREQE